MFDANGYFEFRDSSRTIESFGGGCNVELCNSSYVTMALILRIDLTNGNYPIPTLFLEWF